jgi:hypothetical protein
MSDYAPTGPMDMDKLAGILQEEFRAADSYRDTLEQYEQAAFRYYEARPFGSEVEGRSQIVLPDVQEVVDYMTQSVLRTFVSGDRTVEFEAVDESEVEVVEDASAAINWTFMRRQDGYRLLHDGLQDGLLRKLGIFKTCKETQERVSVERVTVDPLMIGEMPDNIEIEGEIVENEDGTVTATVKQTKIETRFTDYAIAPANFLFSPKARHEDEADYLCHVDWEKTRSDLVEMGFDRDQVYRLPCHSRVRSSEVESDALDQYIDVESSSALDKVELCEEYARIDIDGDGIAERVKVFRVENQILLDAETGEPSIEVVDDHPFAVFCPYPRAHRMVGYSLAEKVMDIQFARSFGARQLFDGMAFANTPRPVVDMTMADDNTIEDILNPIPGSPIRTRGGVGAVQPYQTGFDTGKSLQMMEWLTGERESRTGITRMNQGLDADALNKTATGTAMMQAAGQQQEEYIARNFAETLSRLFVKKYHLMKKEGEPFSVKVDGKYKQVDPSQWPDDMNVTVRVGLGTGSRDKRIQARMAIAEPLMNAVLQGMAGPEHVFKWFDGVARDMGIGQGDDYCEDPAAQIDPETGQPVPKPEKPDPEMARAEAEAQMQQAKLQGEQALQAARLEMQREDAAQKQQLAREQAEFEAGLARDKAEFEAGLARERMGQEAQLAQQRMELEARMALHKADLATQAHDAKLSTNRPGGSLDA